MTHAPLTYPLHSAVDVISQRFSSIASAIPISTCLRRFQSCRPRYPPDRCSLARCRSPRCAFDRSQPFWTRRQLAFAIVNAIDADLNPHLPAIAAATPPRTAQSHRYRPHRSLVDNPPRHVIGNPLSLFFRYIRGEGTQRQSRKASESLLLAQVVCSLTVVLFCDGGPSNSTLHTVMDRVWQYVRACVRCLFGAPTDRHQLERGGIFNVQVLRHVRAKQVNSPIILLQHHDSDVHRSLAINSCSRAPAHQSILVKLLRPSPQLLPALQNTRTRQLAPDTTQ